MRAWNERNWWVSSLFHWSHRLPSVLPQRWRAERNFYSGWEQLAKVTSPGGSHSPPNLHQKDAFFSILRCTFTSSYYYFCGRLGKKKSLKFHITGVPKWIPLFSDLYQKVQSWASLLLHFHLNFITPADRHDWDDAWETLESKLIAGLSFMAPATQVVPTFLRSIIVKKIWHSRASSKGGTFTSKLKFDLTENKTGICVAHRLVWFDGSFSLVRSAPTIYSGTWGYISKLISGVTLPRSIVKQTKRVRLWGIC